MSRRAANGRSLGEPTRSMPPARQPFANVRMCIVPLQVLLGNPKEPGGERRAATFARETGAKGVGAGTLGCLRVVHDGQLVRRGKTPEERVQGVVEPDRLPARLAGEARRRRCVARLILGGQPAGADGPGREQSQQPC